jgi:hypothetical protein
MPFAIPGKKRRPFAGVFFTTDQRPPRFRESFDTPDSPSRSIICLKKDFFLAGKIVFAYVKMLYFKFGKTSVLSPE